MISCMVKWWEVALLFRLEQGDIGREFFLLLLSKSFKMRCSFFGGGGGRQPFNHLTFTARPTRAPGSPSRCCRSCPSGPSGRSPTQKEEEEGPGGRTEKTTAADVAAAASVRRRHQPRTPPRWAGAGRRSAGSSGRAGLPYLHAFLF